MLASKRISIVGIVLLAVVSQAAVPASAAKPAIAQDTAPYEDAFAWGTCYDQNPCTAQYSADAATGLVTLAGNATSRGNQGFTSAWEDAFLDAANVLLEPIQAAVLRVDLDVTGSTTLRGPGTASAHVAADLIVDHPDCGGCSSLWEPVVLISQGDCYSCDATAPTSRHGETVTVTMLLDMWNGEPLTPGTYLISILLTGDSSAAHPSSSGPLGIETSLNPSTTGQTSAEHNATIRVASVSLHEPPKGNHRPEVRKSEVKRNITYDLRAPYQEVDFWPPCDGGDCPDARGDAATGEIMARMHFANGPSTDRTFGDYQETYLVQELDFPYGADSVRLTGSVHITNASTRVDDPAGNGYALVNIYVSIWKWDCNTWPNCGAADYRVLANTGSCGACNAAAPSVAEKGMLDFEAMYAAPSGDILSPGTYEISVVIEAMAKPSTQRLPGVNRDVAMSGATAEISAIVEGLRVEFDPAIYEA